MADTWNERLSTCARHLFVSSLLRARRQVMKSAALVMVCASVLLVVDAWLPFPKPGENLLYDPTDWSLLFRRGVAPEREPRSAAVPGPARGGVSTAQPLVTTLLYRARAGDTMSSISTRLGLNIDTVSSLNRVQGRGVHNVLVGEVLKIPSENGILLAVTRDFDAMCRQRDVSPDDVLAANGITREELKTGMQLFFPGVQHTGFELALAQGVGVSLPLHGWESSPFGLRADPFTGSPGRHSGVDIAAPAGSSIRSGTDGRVVAARFDAMLGNYVEIRGQVGFSYVYGHMSQILTRVGATVSSGQLIGRVGDTGRATGPHLHFEIRKDGRAINPKGYLPGIR
jgi:murein DD-endopeptidase MepM/ murein hydrolase activator NlpD